MTTPHEQLREASLRVKAAYDSLDEDDPRFDWAIHGELLYQATRLIEQALAATPETAAEVSLNREYTEKLIAALEDNSDPVSIDAAEEFRRLLTNPAAEAQALACQYCDNTGNGHSINAVQTKPLDNWRSSRELIDAALNMVDVKGRHHSEIAMNRLIEAAKTYRKEPNKTGGESAQKVQPKTEQTVSLEELKDKLEATKKSLDWYQKRCGELQDAQAKMRDPERTMVCDILANGSLLHDGRGQVDAKRYSLPLVPDEQSTSRINGRLLDVSVKILAEIEGCAATHEREFREAIEAAKNGKQSKGPEMATGNPIKPDLFCVEIIGDHGESVLTRPTLTREKSEEIAALIPGRKEVIGLFKGAVPEKFNATEEMVIALLTQAMGHPSVLEIMADYAGAVETEIAAFEGGGYDGSKWTEAALELRRQAAEIRKEEPELWATPSMRKISTDQIRAIFLENGFTIKDGQNDLRPYVYEAAQALMDVVINANKNGRTNA